MDKYECEGQMSIFDFPEWLPYGEEKRKAELIKQNGDSNFSPAEKYYIETGNSDYWQRCTYSGHTCNKEVLWNVAAGLDGIKCKLTCCRNCHQIMCGARCNGSDEPIIPPLIASLKKQLYKICGDIFKDERYEVWEHVPNLGKRYCVFTNSEISEEMYERILELINEYKKYDLEISLSGGFGYMISTMWTTKGHKERFDEKRGFYEE